MLIKVLHQEKGSMKLLAEFPFQTKRLNTDTNGQRTNGVHCVGHLRFQC